MHKKEGWPRCRIYIYNYSHDTIISHHNSSARDVGSDREQASRDAYQTAAWQARVQRFGPSDLHHAKSDSLSFCVPLILSVCLCLVSLLLSFFFFSLLVGGPVCRPLLHLMRHQAKTPEQFKTEVSCRKSEVPVVQESFCFPPCGCSISTHRPSLACKSPPRDTATTCMCVCAEVVLLGIRFHFHDATSKNVVR